MATAASTSKADPATIVGEGSEEAIGEEMIGGEEMVGEEIVGEDEDVLRTPVEFSDFQV